MIATDSLEPKRHPLLRFALVAVPVFLIVATVVIAVFAQTWRSQRDALQLWQDDVVKVTQETTGPPPIGPDMVVERITTFARGKAASETVRIIPLAQPGADAHRAAAQAIRRNAPRAAVRRGIITPNRETGLTEAEWSQL